MKQSRAKSGSVLWRRSALSLNNGAAVWEELSQRTDDPWKLSQR